MNNAANVNMRLDNFSLAIPEIAFTTVATIMTEAKGIIL